MRNELNEILKKLDALMVQRSGKDEAITLIVDALHRIAGRLPAVADVKADAPPTARTEIKETK